MNDGSFGSGFGEITDIKKDEPERRSYDERLGDDVYLFMKDISNIPLMSKKRELDLINFQIRNEIKKTNYLIEQKSQIYFYAKSLPFVLDINREKFCNTNFENLEIISQILNNVKKSVKENFISVVKEKMESELEINTLTLKINSFKN